MATLDPLEKQVEDALNAAGVRFRRDDHESGLDFYLPNVDLYVEVKRFHTARIADQMSRRPNVIVLQGAKSVTAFCTMVRVMSYNALKG